MAANLQPDGAFRIDRRYGSANLSGGTFSWTNSNGFTASTRAIYGVPLTAGTNTFSLTYTNTYGATSTQTFTITVN